MTTKELTATMRPGMNFPADDPVPKWWEHR